jgi:hypothetical protein
MKYVIVRKYRVDKPIEYLGGEQTCFCSKKAAEKWFFKIFRYSILGWNNNLKDFSVNFSYEVVIGCAEST